VTNAPTSRCRRPCRSGSCSTSSTPRSRPGRSTRTANRSRPAAGSSSTIPSSPSTPATTARTGSERPDHGASTASGCRARRPTPASSRRSPVPRRAAPGPRGGPPGGRPRPARPVPGAAGAVLPRGAARGVAAHGPRRRAGRDPPRPRRAPEVGDRRPDAHRAAAGAHPRELGTRRAGTRDVATRPARGAHPRGGLPDRGGARQAADQHLGTTPAQAHDVDLVLPDGRRLVGTVGAVHGETLGLVTYSKLGAKHRLAAYARLVALTAAAPATAWRAVLLGRTTRKALVEVCQLGPLAEDPAARQAEASTRLATLLDLYDRGLRAPAPLYGNTSQAIARGIAAGKGPWGAAKEWETTNSRVPERRPRRLPRRGARRGRHLRRPHDPAPRPDEGEPDWPPARSGWSPGRAGCGTRCSRSSRRVGDEHGHRAHGARVLPDR
jgi:hypothetical protein